MCIRDSPSAPASAPWLRPLPPPRARPPPLGPSRCPRSRRCCAPCCRWAWTSCGSCGARRPCPL
eukprot:12054327-Alexandrium_andersonii.AAC.1